MSKVIPLGQTLITQREDASFQSLWIHLFTEKRFCSFVMKLRSILSTAFHCLLLKSCILRSTVISFKYILQIIWMLRQSTIAGIQGIWALQIGKACSKLAYCRTGFVGARIHTQLMPDIWESWWACTNLATERPNPIFNGKFAILGWFHSQYSWASRTGPSWTETIGKL